MAYEMRISDWSSYVCSSDLIVAAQGGILFCADLIPGMAWVHVPVSMGYDRFPEQLIEEKRALLDDLRARGVRLFFTHDPDFARSEARLVGRESVRTCKSRWSPDP